MPQPYNPAVIQQFREDYKRLSSSSPTPVTTRTSTFSSLFATSSYSSSNSNLDFKNIPVFDPEPSGARSKVKREVKDLWKWYVWEKRTVGRLRMRNIDVEREEKVIAGEEGRVWGMRCVSFD